MIRIYKLRKLTNQPAMKPDFMNKTYFDFSAKMGNDGRRRLLMVGTKLGRLFCSHINIRLNGIKKRKFNALFCFKCFPQNNVQSCPWACTIYLFTVVINSVQQ